MSTQRAKRFGLFAILVVLPSLLLFYNWEQRREVNSAPTPTPTVTQTTVASPSPSATLNPTETYVVMCTPPLCAIGTNEAYFCAGNCPGGCGTTCATYTPTP